jgi:hypothetical protein
MVTTYQEALPEKEGPLTTCSSNQAFIRQNVGLRSDVSSIPCPWEGKHAVETATKRVHSGEDGAIKSPKLCKPETGLDSMYVPQCKHFYAPSVSPLTS